MTLTYAGQERLAAGRDRVWAAITDPEWLGPCLPGVHSVTVHDRTHFQAVVAVALGPMRGTFTFDCELQPQPDANRLAIAIAGGGYGSAIDMAVGAVVSETAPDASTLDWTGDVAEALFAWAGTENLEERVEGAEWIDPVVLEELRRQS